MVSVTEKKTYAIWIGSLPEDVKESDVFQKFKSYGPICSVKISRHKNGVSRGFGFVNYYDESDAKRAAKEADGNSMFGAEEIKVCFKDGHHTEKDLRPYTDCLHFMKDEKCSKNCIFRHFEPARSQPHICDDWHDKKCLNEFCPRRHPSKSGSKGKRYEKPRKEIRLTRCKSHNELRCFGQCQSSTCRHEHYFSEDALRRHIMSSDEV